MTEMQDLLHRVYGWALSSGFHVAVILGSSWIALKLARRLSNRLVQFAVRQKEDSEFKKRTETLGAVVRHVLTLTIVAVATITILRELGIDIGPVLAAAGIVGLAVGFGAQSLVKDVISGFFILLEDQIRVGDVVDLGGKSGVVERVSLRTTVLRDLHGNVHCIPNGYINVVTNMTKEFSRYVFDIGVAYREDVDQVMEVMKEVDEELRKDPEFKDDIIEPLEILGVDQFASSSVIVRARTTTLPIKQWRVGREFNRRLKKKFDQMDIEIPYPHVTVCMGQGKDGESNPLRVVMKGSKKGEGGEE